MRQSKIYLKSEPMDKMAINVIKIHTGQLLSFNERTNKEQQKNCQKGVNASQMKF